MSELKTLEQVSLVLAFLIPGMVVMWVRARFLTGRMPPDKETLLAYLALSLLYHGIAWPFLATWVTANGPWAWTAYSFVGPAFLGFFLGLLSVATWPRAFLRRWNINLVHPMPSAWDYVFGTRPTEGMIEVRLKDGTMITGWLRPGDSFASSVGKDNDLLIGTVLIPDESGTLTPAQPHRAIYVTSGDIKSITFFGIHVGAQNESR